MDLLSMFADKKAVVFFLNLVADFISQKLHEFLFWIVWNKYKV